MLSRKQATIPEARNTLQHLLTFYPVATLVDQLSSLCAENAQSSEMLDAQQSAKWDNACGKLAVVAVQLQRVNV
jgi:hypothetical protein